MGSLALCDVGRDLLTCTGRGGVLFFMLLFNALLALAELTVR